jgi:hypothetical protein
VEHEEVPRAAVVGGRAPEVDALHLEVLTNVPADAVASVVVVQRAE